MYSAGAAFSAHLTGMAEEILDAVSFSKAALKMKKNLGFSAGKNTNIKMEFCTV
jgi:hypothetical protein